MKFREISISDEMVDKARLEGIEIGRQLGRDEGIRKEEERKKAEEQRIAEATNNSNNSSTNLLYY